MRNILIIAHEFPPSAGGGVQRISKIAQYLPRHGWKPTVLCAEPVSGRPIDETLLEEFSDLTVVRLPSRDISTAVAGAYAPLKRVRALIRQTNGTGALDVDTRSATPTTIRAPLSTRIVRRWFLDSAALWARSVPSEALKLHRAVHFDAVLASGPPPSALIAGRRAAELCGIPFIADFRDGWQTRAEFRWPDDPAKDAESRDAQQSVLDRAELVVATSEPIADELREFGVRDVMVIPNGFDPDDLPRHAPEPGPLRVGFMGRLYSVTDPGTFLDGVTRAIHSFPECRNMRVDVVGAASDMAREMVAEQRLTDTVEFHGFLPHAEALAVVASADVGLVIIADAPGAEAIWTGKLFEYLGVGVPVMLVGPTEGVAAQLIREARAGTVVAYDDPQGVAEALGRFAHSKLSGELPEPPVAAAIAPFDRRVQVAALASALDHLCQASSL